MYKRNVKFPQAFTTHGADEPVPDEEIDSEPDILSSSQETNAEDSKNVDKTILTQLKQKFSDSETTKQERTAILTIAPTSWSERKLAQEFNTTRRQARKAKQLVERKGFFSFPSPKRGCILDAPVVKIVDDFYNDDEVSRQLPGKKDFVSIKQTNGTRLHAQKRLVLCNLKELYRKFKGEFENIKIGFSKFASLRPKNCVLAGSSGTHTVCVCVVHENFKLMLHSIKNSELVQQYGNTYSDFIKLSVCLEPNPQCFLNNCKDCPDVEQLSETFKQLLDNEDYDRIEFPTWETTDRATLKHQVMSVDEFVEEFCSKLKKMKTHDFIARNQARYIAKRKEDLQENEFLIHCDFAENYAFIVQNAVQSFHWNNNQATIHPVIIYHKEYGNLQHESFVFISGILNHDTVMVYCIQRTICNYLKAKYTNPTLVLYCTDGGPQHYKNKYNFKNLLNHKTDFGLKAEWHFHATAHGKGPCDGIGGTIKRLAARASLQMRAEDQILTAKALYDWCKDNIQGININFITPEEYEEAKLLLEPRFQTARTISGTQAFHSFIPEQDGIHLQLRRYSSSEVMTQFPRR